MMELEDLEREVILRIVQLHHDNITHSQAERLIHVAFCEFRGEVDGPSSTATRLEILGNRERLLRPE